MAKVFIIPLKIIWTILFDIQDFEHTLHNSNCHILCRLLFTQSKSLLGQYGGSEKSCLLLEAHHCFLLRFGFCRWRWWCKFLATRRGLFFWRCSSCLGAFLFCGCLLACKCSSCLRETSLLSSLNGNSAAAYSFSSTLRDIRLLQLANTFSISLEESGISFLDRSS